MAGHQRILPGPGAPRGVRTEPQLVRIPLGVVFADREFTVAGDFIYLLFAPALTVLGLTFDRPMPYERVSVRRGDRLFIRFSRFYVTLETAVSGGEATFFVGGDSYSEFVPGPAAAASLSTPASVQFNAEVLALTASWTSLFNFASAVGGNGVIVIFNNGPNPIEVSTDSTIAFGLGVEIIKDGSLVLDNPGGQRWFARAATANQVTGAATVVQGFWTGV